MKTAFKTPGDFNDRLLLGLKGQISEVERYQIHARMQRGRLNKARRGELIGILPMGLDYDRTTQQVRLRVDQSVRHAISHVFELFRQLRSIRAVLHYLSQAQLELPRQIARQGLGQELRWQAPSYDVLYGLLTNPRYAGVYCHGRRQRQHDPLTRQVHVCRRQREDWEVFLPNHHPGYITLAEFEDNQRILADNCSHLPHPGAPRRGPELAARPRLLPALRAAHAGFATTKACRTIPVTPSIVVMPVRCVTAPAPNGSMRWSRSCFST